MTGAEKGKYRAEEHGLRRKKILFWKWESEITHSRTIYHKTLSLATHFDSGIIGACGYHRVAKSSGLVDYVRKTERWAEDKRERERERVLWKKEKHISANKRERVEVFCWQGGDQRLFLRRAAKISKSRTVLCCMNLQYHCALENAVRAGQPEHPTPHTFYPRMQSIFGFWRQWSELRVALRSILRIEVRDFKLPSYGSFLLVIKKKPITFRRQTTALP